MRFGVLAVTFAWIALSGSAWASAERPAAASAGADSHPVVRLNPPPSQALLPIPEEGEASWYGSFHAGRRTTSGERFDPAEMTAAHSTLPLGTWVRVTDQATAKSVTVRINDRLPPHGVRVIDLSRGAAQRLGIVNRGVADVTIEVAEAPDPAAQPQASAAPHRRAGHRAHKKTH